MDSFQRLINLEKSHASLLRSLIHQQQAVNKLTEVMFEPAFQELASSTKSDVLKELERAQVLLDRSIVTLLGEQEDG